MPYGCLYSVNQQAVNIVFQRLSTSGGTAFKQQSQLFDTSPPHLSAQPSPDVKAHLPHKTRPQNTNTSSFFSPRNFTASPHTITHDHTISVWFYDSDISCVYECFVYARRSEERGGKKKYGGQQAFRTGAAPETCVSKRSTVIYRQASSHRLGS